MQCTGTGHSDPYSTQNLEGDETYNPYSTYGTVEFHALASVKGLFHAPYSTLLIGMKLTASLVAQASSYAVLIFAAICVHAIAPVIIIAAFLTVKFFFKTVSALMTSLSKLPISSSSRIFVHLLLVACHRGFAFPYP